MSSMDRNNEIIDKLQNSSNSLESIKQKLLLFE